MRKSLKAVGATGVVSALVLLAAVAVELRLAPPAEAQLGGHAEVTRLELRYTSAQGALEARFHLVTGVAVTERVAGDAAIDRLLEMTEIHASGNARMFVTVEADRVKSWHLAVP